MPPQSRFWVSPPRRAWARKTFSAPMPVVEAKPRDPLCGGIGGFHQSIHSEDQHAGGQVAEHGRLRIRSCGRDAVRPATPPPVHASAASVLDHGAVHMQRRGFEGWRFSIADLSVFLNTFAQHADEDQGQQKREAGAERRCPRATSGWPESQRSPYQCRWIAEEESEQGHAAEKNAKQGHLVIKGPRRFVPTPIRVAAQLAHWPAVSAKRCVRFSQTTVEIPKARYRKRRGENREHHQLIAKPRAP